MSLSMADLKDVFYSAAKHMTIDAVHPVTGKGVWGGKTLAETQADYPDAVVISTEEAAERTEAAARTEPEEITREQFDYFLNVLPPLRWVRNHDAESFALSEFTTGRITLLCVRIGKRYFSFQDSSTLTHDARCMRVLAKFPGARHG